MQSTTTAPTGAERRAYGTRGCQPTAPTNDLPSTAIFRPFSNVKVVCGLIFQKGHVLATRRDPSRAFPLMWEFPGGKVEEGERPDEALLRELVEELNFKVTVLEELEPVPFANEEISLTLLPFLCEPAQGNAPRPIDHTEIRWIEPGHANSLNWAPADLPLVRVLSELEKRAGIASRDLHSGKSEL